jgi:hypothetical protein
VWVDFVGGKTGRGAATLHAVRTWTPNRNGMARGGNILMRGAGAKGWRGGMWFLVTLQSLVRGFLARLRVRRAVAASKLASCVKASLLREDYFRLVMAMLLQVISSNWSGAYGLIRIWAPRYDYAFLSRSSHRNLALAHILLLLSCLLLFLHSSAPFLILLLFQILISIQRQHCFACLAA